MITLPASGNSPFQWKITDNRIELVLRDGKPLPHDAYCRIYAAHSRLAGAWLVGHRLPKDGNAPRNCMSYGASTLERALRHGYLWATRAIK